MTNREKNLIKKQILYALTYDSDEFGCSLFDKKKKFANYCETNLNMIMDKIVLGLNLAQEKLNNTD